jgi:hypothetical protein
MRRTIIFTLCLTLAICFAVKGAPVKAGESPSIIGFGDSWLYKCPIAMGKKLQMGATFEQLAMLIEEHPKSDYDMVVILGGITSHLNVCRNVNECVCDKQQNDLRKMAQEKFPDAEVIVIPMEQILDALDKFDRGDGLHIKSKAAYR